MKHTKKTQNVIDIVRRYVPYGPDQLTGKSRKNEYVKARFMYMYFLKQNTNLIFADIGAIFNRDGATVHHAIKDIKNIMFCDKTEKDRIVKIQNKIDDAMKAKAKTKEKVFSQLLEKSNIATHEYLNWMEMFKEAV